MAFKHVNACNVFVSAKQGFLNKIAVEMSIDLQLLCTVSTECVYVNEHLHFQTVNVRLFLVKALRIKCPQ